MCSKQDTNNEKETIKCGKHTSLSISENLDNSISIWSYCGSLCFNPGMLCSLEIWSIPSWTSMHTQLYEERLLMVVTFRSALINICTWLPMSLFLCLPALSPLYLHATNPWVEQRASTASTNTWNSSTTFLLCVVFFAREKIRVFAKEKTWFSSLCCLWSPPVVYMVKISGTYNPATVCSQSHMWPGQTRTHWRVMARLLSQGWQVSTIMFSFSLTLFFFFSPCLSSKLQF